MKSILLAGFPRGFTSQVHTLMVRSLPGYDATRVSAGEVLNQQRNDVLQQKFRFYIRPEDAGFDDVYSALAPILDDHARGYIVKDVVQPFVVGRYLERNPDVFDALFLMRNLAHVRFALDRKGWGFAKRLEDVVELHRDHPVLDATRIMYEPDYFFEFLEQRYDRVRRWNYLTGEFVEKRERFLRDFEASL